MARTPHPALQQFSAEVKERWVEAGSPAYARIAKLTAEDGTAISQGSISNLLSGKSRPRWDTVRVFVRALSRYEDPNCDPALLMAVAQRWRARWAQLQNELATAVDHDGPADPTSGERPTVEQSRYVDPLTGRADAVGVEAALRQRIFRRLRETIDQRGTLSRADLLDFTIDGTSLPLIDRNRAIRSPRGMLATLSVMSRGGQDSSDEEYGDSGFGYAYRSGTIDGDNQKLRKALEFRLPLILFRMIGHGTYVPIFPVYVVADDRERRRFMLTIDTDLPGQVGARVPDRAEQTRNRVHSAEFRARLLHAYGIRCAVCGLGVAQLLDAVHIVDAARPIDDASGKLYTTSSIENGLLLCSNHHRAFAAKLLGITPDYTIRIADRLMVEGDDPASEQLRDLNGRSLLLPARLDSRPSPDLIAVAFAAFVRDGAG
ncbi:HNH endonuclease [Nocardia caishijiensis]|uniref:HNH endonuclease n=1 Tax=Nocardia caishijiensis TaxID=184756 RepID=A0ABQ6YNA1_9NOCA|nr:HNH endonuclease [Nocardia caishijiensis]